MKQLTFNTKWKLFLIVTCFLALIPVEMTYGLSLTLKTNKTYKLALEDYEYSQEHRDKLFAAWTIDNTHGVYLHPLGLRDTGPKCLVSSPFEMTVTVTCWFQQLIWNMTTLSYMETPVYKKEWNITFVDGLDDGNDEEEDEEELTVTFVHPDLHLTIFADKMTGYASIVSGALDNPSDGSSIVRPELEIGGALDNTNYWKNLNIPDTIRYAGYTYLITSLDSYAFNKAIEVETIDLPKSIKTIGSNAFYWCVNLKSINMPGVKTIGSNAFSYCKELETVQLPDSLEEIGYSAFSDCKKLKEITIPKTCKTIGNDAFMWCRQLRKLVIKDGTEPLKLGYNFELGCEYDKAFYGGERTYRGPFSDCYVDTLYLGRNINLTKTPNNMIFSPFDGDGANGFYKGNPSQYVKGAGSVVMLGIGETVTKLPEKMLALRKISNEITLPSQLDSIGSRAFYQSLTQKELVIPESVTYIGNEAFSFPNDYIQLEWFGEGTDDFYPDFGWPLRTVYCMSPTPAESSLKPFGDCIVHVPSGSGKSYRQAWGGKIIDPSDEVVTVNVRTPGTLYSRLLAQDIQTSDVCRLKLKGTLNDDDWGIVNSMPLLYDWDLSETSVTEFPKDFFRNRATLHSIKLPEGLTEIADSAFFGCRYLSNVIPCPSACTRIGYRAFMNTPLSGMTFSNPVTIGREAFLGCYKFESVIVSTGSSVEKDAFLKSGLKEAIIEDGVVRIETMKCDKITFEGVVESIDDMTANEIHVPNLSTWLNIPTHSAPILYLNGEIATNVTIPAGIVTLKDGAFMGVKTLSSVVLPEGLERIGNQAFNGCVSLSDMTLPSSVKSIGDGAFSLCENFTNITMPLQLATIENNAFSGCRNLQCINFNAKLKEIGDYAFSGCTSLTKIELQESLMKIGNHAFSDCTELLEVAIPKSVNSIGNHAFYNCPKINTIHAQWTDPIAISEDVFSEVSSECFLYIPIGTSTKYFNAGWNFCPKLKETGIMYVSANEKGSLKYEDKSISGHLEKVLFTPYKSFYLDIIPKEGNRLVKLELNGTDIMSEVENNRFLVEEPEEDITITATFADASIKQGDVNGDGVINELDIKSTARFILKSKDEDFHDYWGDMNNDKKINITDALLMIHEFLSKNRE